MPLKMITQRHSTGVSVSGLVTSANTLAAEAGSDFTLESHLAAALCQGRENELGSFGLHVPKLLTAVRETESRGSERAPEIFVQGERYQALRQVGRAIAAAKRDLLLVDGYISSDVLDLFTEKARDATVRILTKGTTPAFLQAAKAFAHDYGHMAVRSTSSIHDRFLVIDDALFLHLGASVKDVGAKTFRMSAVESASEIDKLRQHLFATWSAATVILDL